MPKVSETYRQERRAEILEAARVCFARNGFHGTTLQDIFAEAKLSAGAVYGYFKSKNELILAIAEERHAGESVALAADGADAIASLKAISATFIQTYLANDDQKRRISLITWSEALFDEAILASVKAGVDTPRQALKSLIEKGQRLGEVRKDIAPTAMASAMVAMLQGLALQKLWTPGLGSRAMTDVCDTLIESLRA
jgi:AcrR family transcriptional regulator